MSHVAYGSTSGHGAGSLKGIVSVFSKFANWIVKNHQLRTAERRLYAMDERQLSDIGLNRGDIHDFVWGIRR